MFAVKNLKKTYRVKKGQPVEALKGINLTFEDRGMAFILGKSGSGKSTLLHLMGGLDVPTEGEVVIDEKSSVSFKERDWDDYRNEYIGFVFQDYNLLSDFSVRGNIGLALELQGEKVDGQKIDEILHLVELDGLGDRKIDELSGGQRQRVAIARALVKNPRIIFADEPTGALDSETGKSVLQLLKSLSSDRLVIVVSHDREFAENYGDRIVEIADGLIVSDTGASR